MRTYINESLVQKTDTVVTKTVRAKHKLPQEVADGFATLNTKEERNEYIRRLRDKGWTLQSIADVIGTTRELVRLVSAEKTPLAFDPTNVNGLPLPSIPVKEKVIKTRKLLDPEVGERLRDLHSKARHVRSSLPDFRQEAEELTALINEQTLKGISTYTIAKELGITVAAVNTRLVRYGYRKSTGDSKMFNPIRHRNIS